MKYCTGGDEWNSAKTRKQEIGSSVTSVWCGGIVYVLTLHIRKLKVIHFKFLCLDCKPE